jgi:hypothetical protein
MMRLRIRIWFLSWKDPGMLNDAAPTPFSKITTE